MAIWSGRDDIADNPGVQLSPDDGATGFDLYSAIQGAVVGPPVATCTLAGGIRMQTPASILLDEEALMMVMQASESGQITAQQRTTLESQIHAGICTIFRASMSLPQHAQPGMIDIVWSAQADPSTIITKQQTLELLSNIRVLLDFSALDFGELSPSTVALISGDDNFAQGDGRPTILNAGNTPCTITIYMGTMRNESGAPGVERFSVAFGDENYQVMGDQEVLFRTSLNPGEARAISISAQCNSSMPVGNYKGETRISITNIQ